MHDRVIIWLMLLFAENPLFMQWRFWL